MKYLDKSYLESDRSKYECIRQAAEFRFAFFLSLGDSMKLCI